MRSPALRCAPPAVRLEFARRGALTVAVEGPKRGSAEEGVRTSPWSTVGGFLCARFRSRKAGRPGAGRAPFAAQRRPPGVRLRGGKRQGAGPGTRRGRREGRRG
eukprot:1565221-Pleurochrysis_carterae.AAC.1